MSETTNLSAINHFMEELNKEINKLSNDLNYEKCLNEMLENMRKQTLLLINNCKCNQNKQSINKLNDLNKKCDKFKSQKDLFKSNQLIDEFISEESDQSNDFGLQNIKEETIENLVKSVGFQLLYKNV